MPDVSVTIDGTALMAADPQWSAAMGGYDVASAVLMESDVRRLPWTVGQGSELTVFTADGTVRYQGRLATDPTPNGDGTFGVKGSGHRSRTDKRSDAYRLQTRDYSQWADAAGDPHNYPDSDGISMEVGVGGIRWRVNLNESFSGADAANVALWAEDTNLKRIAFDWASSSPPANYDFRLTRATGPSGTRTTISDANIGATSGSVNTGVISSPQDLITLGLRRTTSGVSGKFVARVVNLRAWGDRTTADTFTGNDVLNDIAGLVGFDSSGVANLTTNVLPLWADQGESWSDVMSYIAMLHAGWWRVLDDRGSGPYLEADTWANARTWTVDSNGSSRRLVPMEKFNKVTVSYLSRSGKMRKAHATAAVEALDSRGLVNVYPLELGDVQGDSTLAATLAQRVVDYLSGDRYEGTIDVVSARDEAGRDDPYGILPGDKVKITDWDQGRSKTLRVTGGSGSVLGMSLAVGGDFLPVDRIESLHGLQSARRRMAARVKPNRSYFDFVGAQARLYRHLMKNNFGRDWKRPETLGQAHRNSPPKLSSINAIRRARGWDLMSQNQYAKRFWTGHGGGGDVA